MLRRIGLAAVLGILASPALAAAQYGDGYGAAPAPQVMTPFVPAPSFNPMMTPEWQQAGGNYEAWQQLTMQKMAAQEQAAFRQQAQAYQEWAKANPKEAAALEKAYKAQMDPNAVTAGRRSAAKKKATAKTATKPATAAAKGAKPATQGAATKPADPGAAPKGPASTLKAARQGTAKSAAEPK